MPRKIKQGNVHSTNDKEDFSPVSNIIHSYRKLRGSFPFRVDD